MKVINKSVMKWRRSISTPAPVNNQKIKPENQKEKNAKQISKWTDTCFIIHYTLLVSFLLIVEPRDNTSKLSAVKKTNKKKQEQRQAKDAALVVFFHFQPRFFANRSINRQKTNLQAERGYINSE